MLRGERFGQMAQAVFGYKKAVRHEEKARHARGHVALEGQGAGAHQDVHGFGVVGRQMPVQYGSQVAAPPGEFQRVIPRQRVFHKCLGAEWGMHGTNAGCQQRWYIGAKVVFQGFSHGERVGRQVL